MQTRRLVIILLALTGAAAGAALHRLLPPAALALPAFGALLLAAGLAVAVPVALGSLGSSGNYQAMARLWTALGALGLLLLCAGAAALLLGLAQGGAARPPWLPIAAGAGLIAGLGLVKISLRRARAG